VTDDKKLDDLRLRLSQNRDFRVSSPLSTANIPTPATASETAAANDLIAANTGTPLQVSTIAHTRFTELLEEFCLQIGLSELPLAEDNRCSINVGENTANPMLITMQLQATESKELIVFFSNIHHYAAGVTEETVAQIDAVNDTLSQEYYLSYSEHYAFLCAEKPVLQITSTQFTDFIEEFYQQAVSWTSRYLSAVAGNTPITVADPVIMERPTRGLKV
jgi:hypothetical protein